MSLLSQEQIQTLQRYCKEYDVEELFVFGSYGASSANAESDVDLLIKFKDISIERYTDNYFTLHSLFVALFHRSVDLVTVNSLFNPYFIEKVNQTKQLLYEDRDTQMAS